MQTTFVAIGALRVNLCKTCVSGGFAVVFLVRAANGNRYALKRLFVNSQHDLSVCKKEIHIAVSKLFYQFSSLS